MKILALDVSTQHVGWCDGIDGVIRGSSCFSPQGDLWERLIQIERWATTHACGTRRPDMVAFEEPRGNHHNMHTNIVLGYANGVILAPFMRYGVEILPVHVMQIKATGVHKGATRVAAATVGKAPDAVGPDEADAIGCWLVAEAERKRRGWEAERDADSG